MTHSPAPVPEGDAYILGACIKMRLFGYSTAGNERGFGTDSSSGTLSLNQDRPHTLACRARGEVPM
jgi:hypothetical protein